VRNVRNFLSVEHVGGVLRYLRGTRRELAPVWRAYAVQPVGGRYDHTAFAFLIDRDGVERVGYPLTDITPEAIAHDARVLLRE
jgi:protein SCO1/2